MRTLASRVAWFFAATIMLGGCALGPSELLIILAIVVLLFGATRLPALGKAVGETLRNFREGSSGKQAADAKKIDAKREPERLAEGGSGGTTSDSVREETKTGS